ncbi:MAG: hypothetical protein ACI9UN_002543 [Granulosicoccus sp.]
MFCSLQGLQPRARNALHRVKRTVGIILLIASASASGSAFAQGMGGITLSDAVPEGFEALMDAHVSAGVIPRQFAGELVHYKIPIGDNIY